MPREMKDSGIEWIGEIPVEWKKNKVFRCFNIIGSGTTPKSTDDTKFEGNINWIQSGDINGGYISESKNHISNEVLEDYSALKVYNAPFIVIAMYGASIGNIAISNIDACVNQACCVLSDSNLDFKYAFYSIKSAQNYLIRKSVGGGQPNISQDIVKSLWIATPSVSEQKKIAAHLDIECAKIDDAITKTKATIEEYKKLKQSVITEAVTKGIRPNREMKDSGVEWIGEIPREWDVKVAFQLFSQVKNKNEGLIEKNLLSLSYGKIKRKSIDTIGGLLPENFDGYNIIEKDDIVLRLTDLQNDHTSLRVGLSNERGIVTSAYLTLRNYSNNMPLYLYYYLHSYDIYKGFYGMGAGVRQGLNWDGVKLLKIVLPPVEEQIEITDYLEKQVNIFDTLIAKKEQIVTELESYKKSIIYEYVTGKKEVV